jgi:signal transduction histidine kinase
LSTIHGLAGGERAAAERDLVPLARSAALGDLAADVAHDVANPLFGVLGLVEILLEDATPGTADADRLRLLHRTALELRVTLRDLLDFARPDEYGSEEYGPERYGTPGDLAAAARTALDLVRHGRGRSLEVKERLPAGPQLVACPEPALEQAALHLLLAARDAGGTVSVEVGAGGLRVAPAGADGVGVLVAARIAADHGGALEADRDGRVLRLPPP